MGVIGKGMDKLFGIKTNHVEPNQLAKLIREHFILGANEEQLNQLEKMFKIRFIKSVELESLNKRYIFYVSKILDGAAFGARRVVWVMDHQAEVYYEIGKRKHRMLKKYVLYDINNYRMQI